MPDRVHLWGSDSPLVNFIGPISNATVVVTPHVLSA